MIFPPEVSSPPNFRISRIHHKRDNAQLFQPTATVAISWWASSLLIEYTEDKSPQLDLEVGLRNNSCELDTTLLLDILLVSKRDYIFSSSFIHGPQVAPLPFLGPTVSIPDHFAIMI